MLLVYYSKDGNICRTGVDTLEDANEWLSKDWVEPDLWAIFDSNDHTLIENNGMVIEDKGEYLLVYEEHENPKHGQVVSYLEKDSWFSSDVYYDPDNKSYYTSFRYWDDYQRDYVDEIIPVDWE